MTDTASPRGPARVPWSSADDALLYEQGRPEYPPSSTEVLADRLDLRPGRRIADVAAGTGKLTRILATTGAAVVAVEPQPGMRRRLRQELPGVPVVAGRAEAIPLATGAVDAATVGQAFHWFDVARASEELHRVIRPGGHLAVVSNQRHEPRPWVRELWAVLRDYEQLAPDPGSNRDWRAELRRAGHFGTFDRFEIANQQRFDDLQDFDARFASISFVLLLDEPVRQALLDDLHRVVADVDPLVIPLRTVIEIATRRG